MSLKDIIPYLPSAFGIYQVWISDFIATIFLGIKVDKFASSQSQLPKNLRYQKYIKRKKMSVGAIQQTKEIIKFFAMGWAALLSLFNAAIFTLISLVANFSANSPQIGVITVFVLLLIVAPGIWWIFAIDPDELVCFRIPILNVTTTRIGQVFLTFCNILLMFAIYISKN